MDELSRAERIQAGEPVLPKRSRSKRGPSVSSGREKPRRDSATSPKALRSQASRPSLTTRTSSAPLVPQSESKRSSTSGRKKEADIHVQRDSVASIKDDPFFKHYQTPHSVSLARELKSAIHEETQGDEERSTSSPSRPGRKHASDGFVNMPVSLMLVYVSRTELKLKPLRHQPGVSHWK